MCCTRRALSCAGSEAGLGKTIEPFGQIEIIGQRSRGKDQLDRLDDARRWLATALRLGAGGDAGAVAAATALLMGMRASEVTDRLVRPRR